MKNLWIAVLLGVVAEWVVIGAALANDSTASLDTGELVFMPNEDIQLLEEDLYISPEEIRVRYLFKNISSEAVTTAVAFPLPPVEFSQDVGYSVNPTDPINFVDFKLWIDGQPTSYQIDATATAGGRDVTSILKSYNIPLTTFTPDMESFDRLRARLDGLPADVMDLLRAEKILQDPGWGDGFLEAWTANVSFYWTQTFAPGRVVEVRHSYTPVPTSTFFTEYDIEAKTFNKVACVDRDFENAVMKKLPRQEYNSLDATILTYILTTANNWRGSIGKFHLTVDKRSTDALVSLCRDGIRKTGPTTFEWEQRGYRPDHDLTVLFVKPLPAE